MRFAVLICLAFLSLTAYSQDEGIEIPWLRLGNESYPPYSPEKPYTGWMTKFFRWGPFRVHAGASGRFTFCDNIYYSQIKKVSDMVFKTELLLRADLLRPNRYYLIVGTKFRRNQYISHAGLSNNEFKFYLDSRLWFRRVFDTGFKASFAQQVEPISVLFADRYGRGIFEATLFANWKTPVEKVRVRFELIERNTNFWGALLDYLDHNEIYFNAKGFWQRWPKLALTARLGYGFFSYADSWLNNFSYIVFYGGARGDISPKTRFIGEIGVYIQSVERSNSALLKEYTGPVWRGTFEWQVTGKMLFYADLSRYIAYHAAANYQVIDAVSVRLRWTVTKRIYKEGTLRFEAANPPSQGGYLARYAWRFAANIGAYYRLKDFLYLGAGIEYVRRLSGVSLASYHVTSLYLHCTIAF